MITFCVRVGQYSFIFQYYAMLFRGKYARPSAFVWILMGGEGGREGGASSRLIDRNAVKDAGSTGGNKYTSQTLHAKFHPTIKHNLMSGR